MMQGFDSLCKPAA